VALKLVVTTLFCVKLVINLWRFATPEKIYCKKRLVYAAGGYTWSLKVNAYLPARKSGWPAGLSRLHPPTSSGIPFNANAHTQLQ